MSLSYEELVNAFESTWAQVGLHEHEIVEYITPATLERTFRVHLFPDHGEPLTDANMPPWVEATLTWGAAHHLHDGSTVQTPLEIQWNYTVPLSLTEKRSDQELAKSAQTAIRQVVRRLFNEDVGHEVLAIEIRRAFSPDSRTVSAMHIYATGTSDISEVLLALSGEAMHTVLREECSMAAALLLAFAETFNPGSVGGYRAVESA
ncbi:MAG: hypothetical protein FJ040_03620 [Chloroflexi bacterium]|nr:hypothetical protein [Chloroflexota bacterium]